MLLFSTCVYFFSIIQDYLKNGILKLLLAFILKEFDNEHSPSNNRIGNLNNTLTQFICEKKCNFNTFFKISFSCIKAISIAL